MERPKYHLLQNIGYMIQVAWEMRKSVLGLRADVLWPLVLATIVITAVLTLLTDAMYHWKMARRATMFQYLRKIYADKIMSMDFCVLDNPKTHEEYATIRENDWFSGWGLSVWAQLPSILVRLQRCPKVLANYSMYVVR